LKTWFKPPLSHITNEEILAGVLKDIKNISDKEYQRRIWIRREGPEVDDFVNTCYCFFDFEDLILQNYKAFKVTDIQYRLLKNFRDKLKVFSDEHELPEEFIDTPAWDAIVEMAKEVLKAFNYHNS
jgi:hypothetical protein